MMRPARIRARTHVVVHNRMAMPRGCLLIGILLLSVCAHAHSQFFDEWGFRKLVQQSLSTVQDILDENRHPVLADPNVIHTYDDKYALVETMTNAALNSYLSALLFQTMRQEHANAADLYDLDAVHDHSGSAEQLDRGMPTLSSLFDDWKSVVNSKAKMELRFDASIRCSFDKEVERSVVAAEHEVETSRGGTGFTGSRTVVETETIKVKRKFREFVWNVELDYSLSLVPSSSSSASTSASASATKSKLSTPMVLFGRGSQYQDAALPRTATVSTFSTSASEKDPSPPIKTKVVNTTVDISWMFDAFELSPTTPTKRRNVTDLGASSDATKHRMPATPTFTIDRDDDTCKTPRRNKDAEAAIRFSEELHAFWVRIERFFNGVESEYRHMSTAPTSKHDHLHREKVQSMHDKLFGAVLQQHMELVFFPIAPVLSNSTVLSGADLETLHENFVSTLVDTVLGMTAIQPKPSACDGSCLMTSDESTVVFMAEVFQRLAFQHTQGILFVEDLMKSQLIQAVGKRLTSVDFDQFMRFNNKKLLGPAHAATTFSHAVRLPGHFPAGVVAIEESGSNGSGNPVPIETISRRIAAGPDASMYIPINDSTEVEIKGGRTVHGWIQHVWNGKQANYQITARANQFSSYMVVLGVMGSARTFLPKDAIIVKNKDEVLIPLLTTPLPSAKEFRDAISSLSLEQQSFAKSYRSMQLETSVFGLCIVQIKPQLEKLLNLPAGSLTKEIKLTQDLMSLFIEYQIPSDLLAFDGEEGTDRVSAVKMYVAAVLEVIEEAKAQQLQQKKQRDEMLKDSTIQESEKVQSQPRRLSRSRSGQRAESSFMESAPMMMQDVGSTDDGTRGVKDGERTSTSTSTSPRSRNTDLTGDETVEDFTLLPKLLDVQLEANDSEGYLRSTIIQTDANRWRRKRQESLILPSSAFAGVDKETIGTERHAAFDLLTALSQSGSLSIDDTELHILVGVSHCFPNSLLETVIEDNVNPIDKAERSVRLMASMIHNNEQLLVSDRSI